MLALATYAALGLLALVFLALQAYGALPHPSDEGIYAYQAARMLDGALPYRDFFHAHPPLHLLATAAVKALTGAAALSIVDVLPALCAGGQGLLAFLAVRRAASDAAGSAGGIVAAGLLLFSPSFLRAACTDTGMLQACAGLAAGAVLVQRRRHVAAGACIGGAAATLLQVVPAAAVLIAFGSRRSHRRWHLLGAALAVFGALQALAVAWAGRGYVEDVYLYQLAKPRVGGEGLRHLGSVLAEDGCLFFAALSGAVISALLGGREGRWRAALGVAWIAATFVALASRPRVFPFYFQPAFFPAAVLAGTGARCLLAEIAGSGRRWRRALASAASVLVAIGVLTAEALSTPILAPSRRAELERLQREYAWTDAPALSAGMNRIVRALLFQDGRREPGDSPNRFTAYVWQRSRWLDTYPALLAAVRHESAERRKAALGELTLFGDSSVVPRLALDAGVPIAGDVADTNVQRFAAGNLTADDVARLLDAHPEALVLLGRREGLGALPEVRRHVLSRYEHIGAFVTRTGLAHDLYRRQAAVSVLVPSRAMRLPSGERRRPRRAASALS